MTAQKTMSGRQLAKKITAILLSVCLIFTVFASSESVFASESKNYKVISPVISQQTGKAFFDNMLVSVRVEPERTLRITLYNYPDYTAVDSIDLVPAATFIRKKQYGASYYYSAHPKLSFFTKRITNMKHGLYSLHIETLDETGAAFESTDTFFIAMPSSSKEPVTIYQSTPSGRVLFFQKVFKNIFGSTVNENE